MMLPLHSGAQPREAPEPVDALVESIAASAPPGTPVNRAAIRRDLVDAITRRQLALAHPPATGPRPVLSISFTLPAGGLAAAQAFANEKLGPGWSVVALDAIPGRYVAEPPAKAVFEPVAWSLAYLLGAAAAAEPSFEQSVLPQEPAPEKAFIPYADLRREPDPIDWNLEETRVKCKGAGGDCAWALESSAGEGVRLCQLDTGYTNHPETSMVDRELVKRSNFVDKDARDDPRDPVTDWGLLLFPGHGTSASSVIFSNEGPHRACSPAGACLLLDGQASSACPSQGECAYVSGVAPKVHFIPFRVGRSVAYASGVPNLLVKSDPRNIALALSRAIDEKCDVVSMALGTLEPLDDIRQAVHAAAAKGIILVAAAGQYAPSGPAWPARFAGDPAKADLPAEPIVAVGGVEPVTAGGKRALVPWRATMAGPEVTLSAPAKRVRVSQVTYNSKTKSLDFSLQTGEGTTFATGQVAGVAAIWLQHQRRVLGADLAAALANRFPDLALKYGTKALVPCAFKASLRSTARKPPEGWDPNFGAGVLDGYEAVRAPSATLPPVALRGELDGCLKRFVISDRELSRQRSQGIPLSFPQDWMPSELKKAFPGLPRLDSIRQFHRELNTLYAGHPELRDPERDTRALLRELASPELRKALGL